jgi:hypothetical protein
MIGVQVRLLRLLCLMYLPSGGNSKINPDINTWTLPLHPEKFQPRFWDKPLLDSANIITNYQQLRPFFEAANKGNGLTVIAFGSSVTADFGGCFNLSMAKTVVHVAPINHLSKCGTDEYPNRGWLHMLMSNINATWPHPKNTVINLGWAAANLHAWAKGSCLEQHLPAKADLILLEQVRGDPLYTEVPTATCKRLYFLPVHKAGFTSAKCTSVMH